MRYLATVLLVLLTGVGLLGAVPSPSPTPTYYGAVADVLQQACVVCHTEGGIAPFPLDDARWAKNMAPAIANALREGRMPPWPPAAPTPALKNERKLSEEAKNILLAWAAADAPLGEPKADAARPAVVVPKPDLVAVLEPPYTPDDTLQDDYRCFLLDQRFEGDAYVTGYNILPGDKRMVHHVLLFVIPGDTLERAMQKDREEAGPGWKCFGGPGVSPDPRNFGSVLGFWVPGGGKTTLPEGTGRLIRAGSRIVMQVHYNTTAGVGPDATQMALYLARTQVKRLVGMTLAAPVELRCPPGMGGESCTRDYALNKTELGFIADSIHAICGTSVEAYGRNPLGDGSRQATSCDWTAQNAMEVYGVTAHMHLRGVEFKVELNPDSPEAKTLFYIPRWNFRWQGEYWYQQPFVLRAGDRVRVTCVYDNSFSIPGVNGQAIRPRYMTWGEGTTDEMCLGSLYGVRQ